MTQVAELRGPVQSVCWVATSSAATHGGPSAGDLGDAPYEEFDDGTEMGRAARQSPIEMLVPQIVDKSVAALSKDGSTKRYRFSSVFGPTVRRALNCYASVRLFACEGQAPDGVLESPCCLFCLC